MARRQIDWLFPQLKLDHGVIYRNVSMLSRRDGIVIQALDGGDRKGYGLTDETPDRAETDRAVGVMRDLYARMAA